MKGTDYSLEILNYGFSMEYIMGSDAPYIVWIYEDDQPVYYNNSNIRAKKSFKEDGTQKQIKSFCLKFANSKNYRKSFLNKNI